MNWLCHIFLAGNNREDQIGGVLADVLSMSAEATLTPGVRRGMALHRSLDGLVDAHPAFLESCRRIARAGVGLRSVACGVAVDVLYDHVLALRWDEFYPQMALAEFAREFYRAAEARFNEMPPVARTVFTYMAAEDWLTSYREIPGIRSTLNRIQARLSPLASSKSPLPAAVDVFLTDPNGFERDFRALLPVAQAHAAAFLESWKLTIAVAGLVPGD